MRSKIYFPEQVSETIEEAFSSFVISQTSKGVAAITIRNYHLHLRSISKHLDIKMPLSALTKRHLEKMVVSMRAAGLAHNTVATYLRVINTFLNWANREGLVSLRDTIPICATTFYEFAKNANPRECEVTPKS